LLDASSLTFRITQKCTTWHLAHRRVSVALKSRARGGPDRGRRSIPVGEPHGEGASTPLPALGPDASTPGPSRRCDTDAILRPFQPRLTPETR
jgi:hypothetical protein